jgi:hypothetical protein
MRWAGPVARTTERRVLHRIFVGKNVGKNHLGDPGVDGRIILRWIFRKYNVVLLLLLLLITAIEF